MLNVIITLAFDNAQELVVYFILHKFNVYVRFEIELT